MAKIMIADDSDSIRLVLNDILSIGEHEVIAEAVDGEDAVKKFVQSKPDLVLLDLAMPKKDGLQVLHEIMEIDPKAKIVLITASEDQKIISQCMEKGALSYIAKPFDFNNVLKIISDSLN